LEEKDCNEKNISTKYDVVTNPYRKKKKLTTCYLKLAVEKPTLLMEDF